MTDMPVNSAIVPEPLRAALRALASTADLLVALDFDGTLAPVVDEPSAARALPEARDAVLRLLSLPHTRVALISGRALASLEEVSLMPADALLVGSHGIELRLDGPDSTLGLSAEELATIDTLKRVLDGVVESLDNVWIEAKPAGFAVHTRLASVENTQTAHSAARERVAAACGEINVRTGKDILEFSVRDTTKGHAIEQLREYTRSSAVFFAGDDVTDEDAFAALAPGDFGLKAGEGSTLAAFRVDGPLEVAAVLNTLAEYRRTWLTAA